MIVGDMADGSSSDISNLATYVYPLLFSVFSLLLNKWTNTFVVMHLLMTGINDEKCIAGQFCHYMSISMCLHKLRCLQGKAISWNQNCSHYCWLKHHYGGSAILSIFLGTRLSFYWFSSSFLFSSSFVPFCIIQVFFPLLLNVFL